METIEIKSTRSTGGLLSLDDVHTLVRLARHAPSGDNCQPWRFEWDGGDTLTVIYLPAEGRHVFNNNHHASWISLGSVLESLDMAATILGVQGSTELLSLDGAIPNTGERAVARIKYTPAESAPDRQLELLKHRVTDRRPYSTSPLPKQIDDDLQAAVAKLTNCRVVLKRDISERFKKHVVRCDEFLWKNISATVDFLNLVSLSSQEIEDNKKGMPYPSVGLNSMDARFMRMIRRHPGLVRWLWIPALKFKINGISRLGVKQMGGAVCLSIKNSKPETVVEAGRAVLRIWLTLNQHGLGAQPMSSASLCSFDVLTGHTPPGTPPAFVDTFKEGTGLLREEFGLKSDDLPIWLFRTGVPFAPLPMEARTPRFSVKELLRQR